MIRPNTDPHRVGIDIYPPVLGGGVSETSSHTVSSYVGGGVCLRREYEVNGEDDSWLSSCKYDPKGESASTTRAATANANSKAIQDDRAEVGKHSNCDIRGPRSEGKAAVRDLRSETCRMSVPSRVRV
jgi:hypothetical protein